MELRDWLLSVSGPGWIWYLKRLSGNDTLANESHQAGPYIPKDVIFEVFPELHDPSEINPDTWFPSVVDSADDERDLRAIWYNNKTRNEARITNWGGRASPILDPENTGGLAVFAFHRPETEQNAEVCRVWVCRTLEEEEVVEDWVGTEVDPGSGVVAHHRPERHFGEEFSTARLTRLDRGPVDCRLSEEELPSGWTEQFPSTREILEEAVRLAGISASEVADRRLLGRRNCEEQLFYSVEEATVLPRIRGGFSSVDEFVEVANSVTNRRKSRSGRSLELHARVVFDEDGLPHSYNEISEGRKKPDFLFPSVDAYQNDRYPEDRLRMLAVKTTCKERWTQILDEASRIDEKHLLTIQEGLSLNQFEKMEKRRVQLVVPSSLHSKYHQEIRPELFSLQQFIDETARESLPAQKVFPLS